MHCGHWPKGWKFVTVSSPSLIYKRWFDGMSGLFCSSFLLLSAPPTFLVTDQRVPARRSLAKDRKSHTVDVPMRNSAPMPHRHPLTSPPDIACLIPVYCFPSLSWDVSSVVGRAGQIRIVDNSSASPWGHINVDEIVLSWEYRGGIHPDRFTLVQGQEKSTWCTVTSSDNLALNHRRLFARPRTVTNSESNATAGNSAR